MTVTASSTRCPACGANATGRFCSSCGSSLTDAAACASCRQPLPAGARFCRHCGASAGGGAPPAAGSDRLPWLIAGALAIALLGGLIAFLARNEKAAPAQQAQVAPSQPGAAQGMPSAADLAAMSPKERFDRLYNRVMRAAEAGDQATVEQFSPMARMAYAQLDSVDADARYHMAMLYLHTGGVPEAKAVVDTLLQKSPGHLFGYMLQGSIARFSQDDKGVDRARKSFLEHYDAEIKKGLPEYSEHQRAVDDFKAAAQGSS
jgi:Double zinc ribbon